MQASFKIKYSFQNKYKLVIRLLIIYIHKNSIHGIQCVKYCLEAISNIPFTISRISIKIYTAKNSGLTMFYA